MNDTFQITNAQTNVRHQSFDLMKFSQMCGVHGFIAKNTVLFQQCQQKDKRAGKKKKTKQSFDQYTVHQHKPGSLVSWHCRPLTIEKYFFGVKGFPALHSCPNRYNI